MRRVQRLCRVGRAGGQAAVVGVLCGLMGLPPGVGAQEVGGARVPVERHAKPLTERERVLQALNRFTFGPRPGDVAAVESVGVQRWFEMQLHPERVDDSGFQGEMGQFPAMGLPQDQLKERFPSGAAIRQMSKLGGSVPSDPVERAIYADSEAVYQEKIENKNLVVGGAQGSVVGRADDGKAAMNGTAVGPGRTHVSEARHGAPAIAVIR